MLTTSSSQDLAQEARDIWLEWNQAIKETSPSDLPRPLTPEDQLLILCGLYHLSNGPELANRYAENLRVMEKTAPDFRHLQFIKVQSPKPIYVFILTLLQGRSADEERAKQLGPEWIKKYHLFDKYRDGCTNGFLDAGSGITLANKVSRQISIVSSSSLLE